ncbi:hypothetical protein ACFDR9_005168 [Janthinobacterium sp. CG_23.3]|uniref:hypothetical protein n=1 Tax=Janthinobacterium sp. CG_23.3 TaxID=3349634 RepID=UPI0038D50482
MSSLELRIKRPLKQYSEHDWPAWTSECKVLSDMLKSSGLQDKTVALETGIDPAVLSKVQTGQARLSESAMDALMDATGSEAWLLYWMLKRGYDPRRLMRIESDLERENRLLRAQIDQLEQERAIELRLFTKLRTAA